MEVIAISVDSLEAHHRFCDSLGGCSFPLASDERLEVASLYEVVEVGTRRSRRAVFVIGQGGTILDKIDPYQPVNVAQFLEVFQALGIV